MTDFKVGDRAKVEIDPVMILENNGSESAITDMCGVETFIIPNRFLKLIERAKPKLEVGQVWKDRNGEKREIISIRKSQVCIWDFQENYFNDHSFEYFANTLAHELITEGENG